MSRRPMILYRYLARDLLLPFGAWMVGLVLMLEGNCVYLLLKAAGGRPLPMDETMRHLVFRIPNAIAWSCPMAFLFGVAMSLNRLSRDGELTSMRMAGLSPQRILIPYVVLGFVSFVGGFLVYDRVMPWANHISDNAVQGIVLHQTQIGARSTQNFFVKPPGTKKVFYARQVDLNTNTMFDVMLCDLFETDYPEFVLAQSARLRNDLWLLNQGKRHVFDTHGRLVETGPADSIEVDLTELMEQYWQEARSPEEQSTAELRRRINFLHRGGQTAFVEITEMHTKASIPFGCVVFALVVGPLAMRFSGGNFTGVLLAVGTLFVFYVILTWGKILGHGGTINPVVGAWLHNIAFAVAGVFLVWKAR